MRWAKSLGLVGLCCNQALRSCSFTKVSKIVLYAHWYSPEWWYLSEHEPFIVGPMRKVWLSWMCVYEVMTGNLWKSGLIAHAPLLSFVRQGVVGSLIYLHWGQMHLLPRPLHCFCLFPFVVKHYMSALWGFRLQFFWPGFFTDLFHHFTFVYFKYVLLLFKWTSAAEKSVCKQEASHSIRNEKTSSNASNSRVFTRG